jgi:hypothetical protein
MELFREFDRESSLGLTNLQRDEMTKHEEVLEASRECPHDCCVEAVDDEGNLIEPPYDVCVNCGTEFH